MVQEPSLSPVTTTAAGVEHQAGSTVLIVGSSLAALVEVVLVGGVWEESIALAGAESRASAGAASAGATSTAAASAASGIRFGLRLGVGGGGDWGQGLCARAAAYLERVTKGQTAVESK